ncbi:MAG: carbon-nitrogen hydrolase family protein [Deltaproteobacteria bacterium]|nr:carbon-nitrogen hydrolase family protein [Deltaproteobacteria bacterium]
MKLTVATCQFGVCDDIEANAKRIRRQMHAAKQRGAQVVHFGEAALSGYAGVDFRSFRGFDWQTLRTCSEDIAALAAELGVWVLLGSAHPLGARTKPHNCMYVIDDQGTLVDRYDKMFCAGNRAGTKGDLAHYSPGEHYCVFEIRGVRCGVLICHDYRYPELYREYKRRGVELMFHAYHTGNNPPDRLAMMRAQVGEAHHGLNRGTTLPEITMPATMHAAAASSHVWISCSNSSAPYSCWPAFMMRADGVMVGRLRRHQPGVLVTTVDTRARLYDSTRDWRDRAMRGIHHSGTLVRSARSRNREAF